MQLSEHFSYAELTKSTTAARKGISNAPSKEHAANLVTLCNEVLEPLRKLYGRPIRISSGYRSPALNKLVGGSLASHHCIGMAVDIDQGSAAENMKIFNLLKAYGSFTQLIYEFGNLEDGPDWVHVSYDKDELNREILRAVQVGKKNAVPTLQMTQDEVIVMLISFVVGLVLKRPGIIQAAIEKVFRKDK